MCSYVPDDVPQIFNWVFLILGFIICAHMFPMMFLKFSIGLFMMFSRFLRGVLNSKYLIFYSKKKKKKITIKV